MKNLIATVLGLSLLASGAAMANPGKGPEHRPAAPSAHAPVRANPPSHPGAPGKGVAPAHRPAPPAMAHGHGPARHVAPPPRHMAPPPVVYRPGYRLPPHVHGIQVRDYRAHGLRKAPRGHEWRRIDNRYLLVAIATGVITEVVLNGR